MGQKAINGLLVNRVHVPAGIPPDWNHESYRGAGIPEQELAFWEALLAKKSRGGRGRYWARMPLATSIDERIAKSFCATSRRRDPSLKQVIFTFIFTADDMSSIFHCRIIEA